jgi:PDZ domain (Also known as DHR or GLGF)./Trypsin.
MNEIEKANRWPDAKEPITPQKGDTPPEDFSPDEGGIGGSSGGEKPTEESLAKAGESFNKETAVPGVDKKRSGKKWWKKMNWKGILSHAMVAVISTFLTLGFVTGFDFSFEENGTAKIAVADSGKEKSDKVTYTSVFNDSSDSTIADIVEEITPAIVGVVNVQQTQNLITRDVEDTESGSGSGVIFTTDSQYAYIITNYHVIEGADSVRIYLYDGKQTDAEIVGGDALSDLAVLKIDKSYATKVVRFGDSSKLRAGDEVIAIGNPLGLELSQTVTRGIISATERNIPVNTSAGEWELTVIQTDAAINAGNSGGALINSRGEVIGINSLKISGTGVEGLGFAIPSNDVVPIARQLIEHGSVKRPYLGIQMYNVSDLADFYRQNLTGSLTEGVIIAAIEEGSPADKAGLKEKDIIVAIDGEKVSNSTDLRKYLYREVSPGDKIRLTVYRDGKKITITVQTIEK